MPSEKEWYYCADCNRHTQNIEKVNECLMFRHNVKKRVPLSKRIIYGDCGFNISHVVKLVVDENEWVVQVTLFLFSTRRDIQGRNKTTFLTRHTLSPPISNMVNNVNHLFPFLEVTSKQLTKLLKTAIKKGVFSEREGQGQVTVFLTLDDWMLLKPKTDDSKLIFTSHSKLQRLFKSDSKVLGEK